MKILIIGDRPSRYNKDPNTAFIGARCYLRLLKWVQYLGIIEYELINSHTPELLYIIANHSWLRITLGANAHKRLQKLGLHHLSLPHPSGVNRLLNDPKYESDALNELKTILKDYECPLEIHYPKNPY